MEIIRCDIIKLRLANKVFCQVEIFASSQTSAQWSEAALLRVACPESMMTPWRPLQLPLFTTLISLRWEERTLQPSSSLLGPLSSYWKKPGEKIESLLKCAALKWTWLWKSETIRWTICWHRQQITTDQSCLQLLDLGYLLHRSSVVINWIGQRWHSGTLATFLGCVYANISLLQLRENATISKTRSKS